MTKKLQSQGNARIPLLDLLLQYENMVKSKYTIVQESMQGAKPQLFYDLVQLSGIEKNRLAEDVFHLSLKTIQRYKKEKKALSPRHSELALNLILLYSKGKEVFGELSSFHRWLKKPAFGLGGSIPFSFMNTITGIELIYEELTRIEFGDLA